MLLEQIFYSTFWVSAFSIVWFCTDWFIHYTQLLGIMEKARTAYTLFISNNPDKYFPDFLFELSKFTDNRFIKFICKMLSCPFCLMVWLSLLSSTFYGNAIIAAPVYVLSLFIVLKIKQMF